MGVSKNIIFYAPFYVESFYPKKDISASCFEKYHVMLNDGYISVDSDDVKSVAEVEHVLSNGATIKGIVVYMIDDKNNASFIVGNTEKNQIALRLLNNKIASSA